MQRIHRCMPFTRWAIWPLCTGLSRTPPLLGESHGSAPHDNRDRVIDDNVFEVVRDLKFGIVGGNASHFVRRRFIAATKELLLREVVQGHRWMLRLNAWIDEPFHVIGAK